MYRRLSIGVYLTVGVLFASLAVGCTEQTPDLPSEADIQAAHANVLKTAPTPKYKINAQLEDHFVYLGMDVDTDTVTPGKPFTLTHYWKVLKPVTEDWKLFVHLETPDSSKNHLNADHTPIDGKYPIKLWKTGEIIRDIHRVSVPANWPAKEIDLYVGMWKGPVRMKVTSGPHDNENRVLVARIPVAAHVPGEHKRLIARHVKNGSVKIDGKLDEKVWRDAAATGPFVQSIDGLPAPQPTDVRVLWDDHNLYVAFDNIDNDVWATITKRDGKLWTEEADEMFIDADGDGKTYVELQVNPRGALFDSYLPSYRKDENDWDSHAKVAVKVDGTLDKRTDADKGWTVEMAIPLEAARGKEAKMDKVPPKVGDEWRVNFYRMDQPAGRPQQGYAWNPPMVSDFHALDKFGGIVFGNDKGQVPGQEPLKQDAKAAAPAKHAEGPHPHVRMSAQSLRPKVGE